MTHKIIGTPERYDVKGGPVEYMDATPLVFAGQREVKQKSKKNVEPINFNIDVLTTSDPNYVAFSVADWQKILTALECAGANLRHVQKEYVPVISIQNVYKNPKGE